MIRVTKTWIRPNKNVPFFVQTEVGKTFSAYRQGTYGSKLSNESTSLSADGLTLSYSVTWPTRADRDACQADPTIQSYNSQADAYNASNGIYASDSQIVNL